MQPVQASPGDPPSPLPDRLRAATQALGYLHAQLPIGRGQHDAAPQRERLRALRAPRPPLQDLPLLITEHDLDTLRHNCLPSSWIRDNFAATAPAPANYRLSTLGALSGDRLH